MASPEKLLAATLPVISILEEEGFTEQANALRSAVTEGDAETVASMCHPKWLGDLNVQRFSTWADWLAELAALQAKARRA